MSAELADPHVSRPARRGLLEPRTGSELDRLIDEIRGGVRPGG